MGVPEAARLLLFRLSQFHQSDLTGVPDARPLHIVKQIGFHGLGNNLVFSVNLFRLVNCSLFSFTSLKVAVGTTIL